MALTTLPSRLRHRHCRQMCDQCFPYEEIAVRQQPEACERTAMPIQKMQCLPGTIAVQPDTGGNMRRADQPDQFGSRRPRCAVGEMRRRSWRVRIHMQHRPQQCQCSSQGRPIATLRAHRLPCDMICRSRQHADARCAAVMRQGRHAAARRERSNHAHAGERLIYLVRISLSFWVWRRRYS